MVIDKSVTIEAPSSTYEQRLINKGSLKILKGATLDLRVELLNLANIEIAGALITRAGMLPLFEILFICYLNARKLHLMWNFA